MTSPTSPAAAVASTWSWGSFMFDPVVMIATERYKWLLVYLLMFIPFINLIALLAVKIYFGLNGQELIMSSTAFANNDEKKGFLKGIDKAGKILFFVGLALIAVSFIFGLGTAMTMLRFGRY